LARRIAAGWLGFNKAAVPLFRFASAASRESPVQAANKQRHLTRTAQLL